MLGHDHLRAAHIRGQNGSCQDWKVVIGVFSLVVLGILPEQLKNLGQIIDLSKVAVGLVSPVEKLDILPFLAHIALRIVCMHAPLPKHVMVGETMRLFHQGVLDLLVKDEFGVVELTSDQEAVDECVLEVCLPMGRFDAGFVTFLDLAFHVLLGRGAWRSLLNFLSESYFCWWSSHRPEWLVG